MHKKHWQWHRQQGDTWNWFAWTVLTGQHEGMYLIASFGHTWQELEREIAVTSGNPAPDADWYPLSSASEERFYVFRPDLSLSGELEHPLPFMSCIHVVLKPGKSTSFESALKRLNEELRIKTRGSRAPIIRWYELESGGEWPQFLGTQESPTLQGDTSLLSPDPTSLILNGLSESFQSISIESLQFRPELSLINPAK